MVEAAAKRSASGLHRGCDLKALTLLLRNTSTGSQRRPCCHRYWVPEPGRSGQANPFESCVYCQVKDIELRGSRRGFQDRDNKKLCGANNWAGLESGDDRDKEVNRP
jgi:hypothetical protein